MKQQKGFTLIELIIVIVILGILAVTAAPRFIDIQSDARKETLQGVKAAIQGASQLVYAKSAIAGTQKAETGTVSLTSGEVPTKYGYPDANGVISPAVLQRFVDVDLVIEAVEEDLGAGIDAVEGVDGQLALDPSSGSDNIFRVRFNNIPTAGDGSTGCYVQFTSADAPGTTPTLSVLDNGC
jgi:MSHA pilin protein MshA